MDDFKTHCFDKKVKRKNMHIPALIGDEEQIPCTADYALWTLPRDDMNEYTLNGLHVYQNADYFLTMKEIVRQSNDKKFAEILSRIHSKSVTLEDCNLLEERRSVHIQPSELKLFENEVHLFATNSLCYLKIYELLKKLNIPVIKLEAIITPECKFCKEDIYPLYLYPGAQIVLTRNFVVQRSLYNGSEGVVVDLYFQRDTDKLPVFITCNFTNYSGPVLEDGCGVPVVPTTEKGYCIHNDKKVKIKKHDFTAAKYLTHHRAQGKTLDKAVGNLLHLSYQDPRLYTSLSRVRARSDLVIESPKSIKSYLVKDV